jgi:hypothetical protein
MAVTVSDQDRALLRLIADGEAVRSNPYCSVWPGHVEPELTSMTISQVQAYQQNRLDAGRRSSACGKYQMLKGVVEECTGYLGCDPLRTVFSPDVQDAMIIKRLEKFRRYNQWKTGSVSTGQFMVFLAAEFASMPVPFDVPAGSVYSGQPKRNLRKGQSFYAGDGLNKANHDPDHLYQALEDIKNGGTGEIKEIDVTTSGANRALPVSGVSDRAQVERVAAGAGVGAYRQTRAGEYPINSLALPEPNNPYVYGRMDPLDDRYDFRTGEKVKDILIHGISSAAATPITTSSVGASDTATNAGVAPVEAPSDPDAANPSGQETLPDLVPKDVPDPLPTEAETNEDESAPGLPFSVDDIKDAVNKGIEIISKKIPDFTPCVDSILDGASLSKEGITDQLTNAIDDAVGEATQLVENEAQKTIDAAKQASKSWVNTGGI